ncbi:hypothetical protein PBRA_006996 [Plasmodiophora brassicae]|uniref:Uncharacterized protein n=1 Tax=Plasmodiophora brassicae TaxID=37360 RepID=A0A0G4IUG6_PLABS|nr:hypothetical protein PBRA_006996 [Plasmodiophora brassicae]
MTNDDNVTIASLKCALLQSSTTRKLEGDFFTPAVWVRQAYALLDAHIAPSWYQDHVVWDASCGTANLTRLRAFPKLLLSTKNDQDLRVATLLGYARAPSAQCTPFDFLESMDAPEPFLPTLQAANGIVFLNNPPYKTANEQSFTTSVKRHGGLSATPVKQAMRDEGLTAGGNQLAAQFLFKLTTIMRSPACSSALAGNGVYLASYTPGNLITGPAYFPFMRYLMTHWQYVAGFTFPATEFQGVVGRFSIAFTLWKARPQCAPAGRGHRIGTFPMAAFEYDDGVTRTLQAATRQPRRVGQVTLRAVPPEHRINRWASSSPTKHCRPAVPLTNPVSVLQQCRYKVLNALPGDALGYCHSNGNSVQHNDQLVGLYSSAFAAGHGFAVRPDNFERACALFAARRLVRRSALTWQAEYSAPTCDPADPRWRRWVRDAVVFALFDTKSNQSALRGLPGPVPSLSNPWFWASKSSMRALAVEADFSDMVDDIDRCRAPDRPFVAEWLQNNRSRLGDDARLLLEFGERILAETMPMRTDLPQRERALLHLHAWDSGWYQIRQGLKRHSEGKRWMREWDELRTRLAGRLRPGIHEWGLLPQFELAANNDPGPAKRHRDASADECSKRNCIKH